MEQQQNSPIILNVFDAGQVSDLDSTKTKNTSFVDAENIRLFDLAGHGLVLTNIRGNEYSINNSNPNDNIGFKLTDGFVPMGGCVYNGVAFIVSRYQLPVENQDYCVGEIGCFPSLNQSGVFERVYRPLQNFDDGNGGTDFRTELFKFYPGTQCEVIPWEDIDGTIDLIITDNTNPLRVINTGFDMDGMVNDRVYSSIHFPGAVSCILSTRFPLSLSNPVISLGGNLLFGNYFFYFRYADQSFNRTHFFAESRPVQVNDGGFSIGSARGSIKGKSNKKVTFTLDNLDRVFSFVEVGYVRFFSGEDGQVSYEAGVIDNEYTIPAQGTLSIVINGSESHRVIPLEEIIANRQEDDIVRTIAVAEKRLWGASWKGGLIYHDGLSEFAQLVTIRVNNDLNLNANPFSGSESDPITLGSNTSEGQYMDPVKTAEKTGYFRTEAYPFALQFELTNGYLTAPVPIKGFDAWKYAQGVLEASCENDYGIFRFPGYDTHPTYTNDGDDKVTILGVTIDFEAAITAVLAAATGDDLYWVRQNVRSVQVVRGERFKTIEYQGLAVQGCRARTGSSGQLVDYAITEAATIGPTNQGTSPVYGDVQDKNWGSGSGYMRQAYGTMDNLSNQNAFWGSQALGADDTNTEVADYIQDLAIPIFRAYAPMIYLSPDDGITRSGSVNRVKVRNYMSRWWMDRTKLAVFSPDFMFSAIGDASSIRMIKSVGKTLPTPSQYAGPGGAFDLWQFDKDHTSYAEFYPRWTLAEMTGGLTASELSDTGISVGKVGEEVDNLPQNPSMGMVNMMKDFWSSDVETMFHATDSEEDEVWSNRSLWTPKYIAIERNSADDEDSNFNLDIVNLYNTDDPYNENGDIANLFPNLATVRYAKIGQPIYLSWDSITPSDYNDEAYYGGDCFLQRTYFKIQGWAGTSFNGEGWDHLFTYSEDVADWTRGDYPAFFSHGLVVGIITENAVNTAMRGINEEQLFYPFTYPAASFAKRACSQERKENFRINQGYSIILGVKQVFGHDPRFPVLDRRKKVRFRYSDESQPGSYYNGYRVFRQENKRDFHLPKGEVMRILSFEDYLVSIQENAINLHYINERQMLNDPDNPGLVMGKGEILSEKYRTLANFGSQHQWAICPEGYGLDVNRRIIWRIIVDESTGYTKIKAVPLSEEKYCSKFIYDTLDEWSRMGDIVNRYGDSPLSGEGVAVYYDARYKEVYFVFVNQQAATPINASDQQLFLPIE